MKVFNFCDWNLSPHCYDHVHPETNNLKDEQKEYVVVVNGKTYWPASMAGELKNIITEAAQNIEAESSWIQTIIDKHKSLAWKLYTCRGIELHLSVTQDDSNTCWVHAYPTEKQSRSGRKVLYL